MARQIEQSAQDSDRRLQMTRATILALVLLAVGIALAVLAGCTNRIPVDRATVAAHELVGFDWCSPAEIHQCAMIRDRKQMFLLPTPGRYGDEGAAWNTLGVTVDAFSPRP